MSSVRECRLCSDLEGPFVNVFGQQQRLADKLRRLMPALKIDEWDHLSHKVCFRCSARVVDLHEFVVKCEETQAALRSENESSDRYCDELVKRALDSFSNSKRREPRVLLTRTDLTKLRRGEPDEKANPSTLKENVLFYDVSDVKSIYQCAVCNKIFLEYEQIDVHNCKYSRANFESSTTTALELVPLHEDSAKKPPSASTGVLQYLVKNSENRFSMLNLPFDVFQKSLLKFSTENVNPSNSKTVDDVNETTRRFKSNKMETEPYPVGLLCRVNQDSKNDSSPVRIISDKRDSDTPDEQNKKYIIKSCESSSKIVISSIKSQSKRSDKHERSNNKIRLRKAYHKKKGDKWTAGKLKKPYRNKDFTFLNIDPASNSDPSYVLSTLQESQISTTSNKQKKKSTAKRDHENVCNICDSKFENALSLVSHVKIHLAVSDGKINKR